MVNNISPRKATCTLNIITKRFANKISFANMVKHDDLKSFCAKLKHLSYMYKFNLLSKQLLKGSTSQNINFTGITNLLLISMFSMRG